MASSARCRDREAVGPLAEAGSRDDVVIRSVGGLVLKRLTLGGGYAQALSLEGESAGVVHEAIEDGVKLFASCDGKLSLWTGSHSVSARSSL